jgi:hypothetical protein
MASTTAKETETGKAVTNHKLRHRYSASIQWLAIDELQTEPGFTQRPFDPSFAKKLAQEFDPDLVGFPLVVRIGVRLVIIDGQHRVAGARQAFGEGQRIQCELVEDITVTRAAQLFRGRNTRRNVKPLADFLVGITAKDPTISAINNALTACGWHVAGTAGNNSIAAVVALMRIYRLKNNADLITAVLSVIRNAWGNDSANTAGEFMVGLALVLNRYSDIDRNQLIQRLKRLSGVGRVIATARGLREGLGGSIANNIARNLVTIYNTGRRNKLAEWGTTASTLRPYEQKKPTTSSVLPGLDTLN